MPNFRPYPARSRAKRPWSSDPRDRHSPPLARLHEARVPCRLESCSQSSKAPILAVGTLQAGLWLHECGHVAAGWLTQGHLAEFVLFSVTPHVRIVGSCTAAGEALRAVGGSGFVLLWYAALRLFIPRRGQLSQLVSDVAFWFVLAELLGWGLSALFPNQNGPNDAADFLRYSGISRLALAGTCGALAAVAAVAQVFGNQMLRHGHKA